MKHLGEALNENYTLTHLILNHSLIDDHGVCFLVNALKTNAALTTLDLGFYLEYT